ncbi:sulfatase [Halohasta salina]|uniref:sulfatase n=1 Tax=Halohasta salina TaxID=2961621 RepID=UPI0020A60AEA|nr:sulfatase [Halohasta salina]
MNIVLVTIDCLRRDRCGIYGHHRDTTPTLDALGREGFVFDNAYATGPVTTESFPGILAGRLSAQCVAGENLYQKRIPDGEPTIASHLQEAGYDTVGVISNPRIGTHVDTDRGFETFRNLRTDGRSGTVTADRSRSVLPDLQVGERLYQLRESMREHDSVPYRYELPFLGFRTYQYITGWPSVRGERVIDTFLNKLSAADAPFFGWTHLMDVHGPIHPDSVGDGGFSDGRLLSQFRSHARRVSDVQDVETEARYDSAVRYADSQVKRIVDWLQSNDIWEETALIVTADHGDALYDRGIYGHPQHYTYDELLAVPLIVRVPGEDGGRLSWEFSLGWLHELITDLCGLKKIEAPLSLSREHSLTTEATQDEGVLLADSISHYGHTVVARSGAEKHVTQTNKLGKTAEISIQPAGLYRTDIDPKERIQSDSVNAELRDRANEIVVEPNSLNSFTSGGFDQATMDRLKQLGYAE